MKIAVIVTAVTMVIGACTSGGDTPPDETPSAAESSTSESPEPAEPSPLGTESPTASASTAVRGIDPSVAVESNLSIAATDHDIPATLTLPTGASPEAPVAGVVLLHGTGGSRNETSGAFAQLALALAAEGVASIRIDFIGSGESAADPADFDFASAQADAQAAATYLAQNEAIDGDRLGILGYSQGGMHALLVAANQDWPRSVVTWAAPAEGMGSFIPDVLRQLVEENGYVEIPYGSDPLVIGEQWVADAESTEVLAAVATIDVPILALAGSEDWVVDPADAAQIAGVAPNASNSSTIYPGVGHNLGAGEDAATFDDVTTDTAAWFADTLR